MNETRPMSELEPLIRTVVEAGGEFKFITRGTSMLPLLRNGVDTAVLTAFCGTLKKGDVPLYKRENGQYVLHRAVKVNGGESFVACGDNQFVFEKNVPQSSIIAVMTAYIKDGVRHECRGKDHRRYVASLSLHRVYLRLRVTAVRVLRHIKKRNETEK